MSILGGPIPGKKKKKNSDLTIGKFLKKLLKGKPSGYTGRIGPLPGSEKNTPYTELAKRYNNKSVKKVESKTKKKLTPAQIRFKKREAEGKSGLTGGPKGETIAEYRDRQKKRIQDSAKKRNEQFKKTGKSSYEERQKQRKKAMQDAARKRNETYKATRKLKIKEKKNKKK